MPLAFLSLVSYHTHALVKGLEPLYNHYEMVTLASPLRHSDPYRLAIRVKVNYVVFLIRSFLYETLASKIHSFFFCQQPSHRQLIR